MHMAGWPNELGSYLALNVNLDKAQLVVPIKLVLVP